MGAFSTPGRRCSSGFVSAGAGLDAGPHTIAWHLRHHHQLTVPAAAISRYLTRRGLVVPEPRKRTRSS